MPQFDSCWWDQADLAGDNAHLRLAMKAARRLPRAHGIAVVSDLAAVVTDLMKRVFVMSVRSSMPSIGSVA